MRKALLALTFFLVAPLYAEVLTINKFSGLNTDDSPLMLTEGQTPDSENVLTDVGPGITGRPGFIRHSTEASSGLWVFPVTDGTRYEITKSSNLLKAGQGNGTFDVTVSTVPIDRIVVGSALGDRFYFADTLNGLKYWDGASVTVASAAMTVDKLVTFKGRLAAAGKATAPRVIYLSKYLDGAQFTTPTAPSDDDATQLTVAGAIDEPIEGLFASFQDKLMWFKRSSFGAIFGSRRSNFTSRTFSDFVGLASPESIQDCDGLLRWLAPGRTVWEFDGTNYANISEDVDDLFGSIVQGDSAVRSQFLTTSDDWSAGTKDSDLTATIAPGDLRAKTTYFHISDQAEFSAGTLTGTTWYADVNTASGTIQTTFPDFFDSFRDGGNDSKNVWTRHRLSTDHATISTATAGLLTIARAGTASAGIRTTDPVPNYAIGTTFYFNFSVPSAEYSGVTRIVLATGAVADATDPTAGGNYWDLNLLITNAATCINNFSNSAGTIIPGDACGTLYVGAPRVTLFLATTTFRLEFSDTLISSGTHSLNNGQLYTYIYNLGATTTISVFGVAPQTFTYTAVHDTEISTPVWSRFYASTSGANGSISMTMAVSADNSSYDAAIAISSGILLSNASKRYAKVTAIFSNISATANVMGMSHYNFGAGSSGTFTSAVQDLGPHVTSWGPITVSHSVDDGSITYAFNASSQSAAALFNPSSWTTFTNGGIPTNGVERYIMFRATFSVNNGTGTASLSDITFNWTEGSSLRAHSAYFDRRYWLAVAIASTSNNRVLVYDQDDEWQRYSGINADAFALYKNTKLFGNSTGIYQAESGFSDNGETITSYYVTPTFAPAGPDFYSRFGTLYVVTDNSESTLESSFQLDGTTTTVNFGDFDMNETAGIQTIKLPFSSDQAQQSRMINFRFGVEGTDFWRILSGNLYFDRQRLPF